MSPAARALPYVLLLNALLMALIARRYAEVCASWETHRVAVDAYVEARGAP